MKSATLAACGLAIVTTLTLSCSSPLRDEPSTTAVPLNSEKLQIGQQVFMEYCHTCHPNGAAGLAPAINDKPLPRWLMKTQVRVGLGAMPGFDKQKISDDQLDALIEYLKKLRAHDVPPRT
jgi:mono/diheme cytochrome c family protein